MAKTCCLYLSPSLGAHLLKNDAWIPYLVGEKAHQPHVLSVHSLQAQLVFKQSARLSVQDGVTNAVRSSHADYRSILVLTSLANTRAGQSERRVLPAPIRTHEWSSRQSDQRRILVTQPRGTPEHERQLVTPFRSLCFS